MNVQKLNAAIFFFFEKSKIKTLLIMRIIGRNEESESFIINHLQKISCYL